MPKCEVCGAEIPHSEYCRTPKMVLEVMDRSLQIARTQKKHVVDSECVKQAIHELYCPNGKLLHTHRDEEQFEIQFEYVKEVTVNPQIQL
jgi:Pyruvate/2-oxoacid:ferredoxin oxidoreductase delta subunit